MNRNKILTITAVMAVLLLTIGTGLSLARGGSGMRGPGMKPGSPFLGCVYKLNLSAETKAAIKYPGTEASGVKQAVLAG